MVISEFGFFGRVGFLGEIVGCVFGSSVGSVGLDGFLWLFRGLIRILCGGF